MGKEMSGSDDGEGLGTGDDGNALSSDICADCGVTVTD